MNKLFYIILIIIPLKLVAEEAVIYEKKIHVDSVDSLCVSDKAIVSASFDGSIKKTIDNKSKDIGKHKDWVRKVICTDSDIISASNDGMITIWNDLKKTHSVQAHSWWVTDIALSNDKIISVSLDETVKVWSYPGLKLLYSHKLYGSNKHYSVIINNSKAFIGSTHGSMFVLDMNSYKWLEHKRIAEYHSVLTSVEKSDKYVFFGTSDGFIIKVMASAPYNLFKEKISDYAIKALAQKQGILYVGDDNGVLRKISTGSLKPYSILNHYAEAVRTLAIDNNSIYAGYDKGYIRNFNISTELIGK